jgi:hypothetical protein
MPLPRYFLHPSSLFLCWAHSLSARFAASLPPSRPAHLPWPNVVAIPFCTLTTRVPATICRVHKLRQPYLKLPWHSPLDSRGLIAVPPLRCPQQKEILSMRHTCSVALKVQVTGSWDRGLEKASHHDEVAPVRSQVGSRPAESSFAKKNGQSGCGRMPFPAHTHRITLNVHEMISRRTCVVESWP